MNTAQPGKKVSIPAASDISSTPYRFVTAVTTGTLALAGAGAAVDGVYNGTGGTAAGSPASVTVDGIELVEVGGSVTIGDIVKSDAAGRAVTASAADVLAGLGKGRALATGSSGYIPVLIFPGPNPATSSGVETLTGAGEASVYYAVTECVATSDAITLANGLIVGQRKTIRLIAGSTGNNTVTPATVSANTDGGTSPAAVTLTTIGQEVTWEWRSDGWKLVEIKGAGVGAVTDASTVNLMHSTNHATISGTDVITLPAGYYPGQETHITVIAAASTPVMDVAGLFYDEDGSADGTNVTFDAAAVGNWMRCVWSGARWQLQGHLNAAVEV